MVVSRLVQLVPGVEVGLADQQRLRELRRRPVLVGVPDEVANGDVVDVATTELVRHVGQVRHHDAESLISAMLDERLEGFLPAVGDDDDHVGTAVGGLQVGRHVELETVGGLAPAVSDHQVASLAGRAIFERDRIGAGAFELGAREPDRRQLMGHVDDERIVDADDACHLVTDCRIVGTSDRQHVIDDDRRSRVLDLEPVHVEVVAGREALAFEREGVRHVFEQRAVERELGGVETRSVPARVTDHVAIDGELDQVVRTEEPVGAAGEQRRQPRFATRDDPVERGLMLEQVDGRWGRILVEAHPVEMRVAFDGRTVRHVKLPGILEVSDRRKALRQRCAGRGRVALGESHAGGGQLFEPVHRRRAETTRTGRPVELDRIFRIERSVFLAEHATRDRRTPIAQLQIARIDRRCVEAQRDQRRLIDADPALVVDPDLHTGIRDTLSVRARLGQLPIAGWRRGRETHERLAVGQVPPHLIERGDRRQPKPLATLEVELNVERRGDQQVARRRVETHGVHEQADDRQPAELHSLHLDRRRRPHRLRLVDGRVGPALEVAVFTDRDDGTRGRACESRRRKTLMPQPDDGLVGDSQRQHDHRQLGVPGAHDPREACELGHSPPRGVALRSQADLRQKDPQVDPLGVFADHVQPDVRSRLARRQRRTRQEQQRRGQAARDPRPPDGRASARRS